MYIATCVVPVSIIWVAKGLEFRVLHQFLFKNWATEIPIKDPGM
jgi:hypothetical protein